MKRAVLVTGGAGYIGGHVALALGTRGEQVVVLDDLSESRRSQVPPGVIFVEGSVGNVELVQNILRTYDIRSVLHFAGFIRVGESVREPEKYFKNNTENTRILAELCSAEKVEHFIFSSSAAVYGNPERVPIDENDRLLPINPYGESKLRAEKILVDLPGMQKGILRYFNVAGTDPEGRIGYKIEEKPTHMIRSCIRAHIQKEQFVINGNDFPTKDGTCVRDYIHVADLAEAHLEVLDYLREGGGTRIYNCGDGHGYSNLEVVTAVRKVTGSSLEYSFGPRREGDPAALIADSLKIRKELGWKPERTLENMIEDELRWVKTQMSR